MSQRNCAGYAEIAVAKRACMQAIVRQCSAAHMCSVTASAQARASLIGTPERMYPYQCFYVAGGHLLTFLSVDIMVLGVMAANSVSIAPYGLATRIRGCMDRQASMARTTICIMHSFILEV